MILPTPLVLDLNLGISEWNGGCGGFSQSGWVNIIGWSGCFSFMIYRNLVFKDTPQIGAILKGVKITNDCDFNSIVRKLHTLMVCGWNGFHGVNPWLPKDQVVWQFKIQDLECGIQYCWSNFDRQYDNALGIMFFVIIGFDKNYLSCVHTCFREAQCLYQF